MIRFAVQSGLRREELASFPLAYLIDPDKTGGVERNLRLNLDPADGTGMKTNMDKVDLSDYNLSELKGCKLKLKKQSRIASSKK